MTYEEAIEMLDAAIEMASYKMTVALLMAKHAIEKQIPKKPIIEHYKDHDTYSCPKCGRRFICKGEIGFFAGIRSEFCDKCGKAIDWSDGK